MQSLQKNFSKLCSAKDSYRKCTRAETVGYAGLNVIDNLELDLQVFKCQVCGKMFCTKRHGKLLEVKNMDINFNSACCEKDFSSQPPLNGVQISVGCCDFDLKSNIGNNYEFTYSLSMTN